MSLYAIRWAWTVRGLSVSERVVLLRLADLATAGGQAWPTVDTLARDCEMSPTTARNVLHALVARKLIGCQQSRGRVPNVYTMPSTPQHLGGSTHQMTKANPPNEGFQPTNSREGILLTVKENRDDAAFASPAASGAVEKSDRRTGDRGPQKVAASAADFLDGLTQEQALAFARHRAEEDAYEAELQRKGREFINRWQQGRRTQ